jgi:REP element-mobilizing transposase RayT
MPHDPNKGYRALRQGRFPQGGGEYFITFCTDHRQTGLSADDVAHAIYDEIGRMETEAVWSLHCGVIMPNHIHLLFQLGQKLPLGKTIARLKSKSSAPLKTHGLKWQNGYFEHTLRERENRLPVFLYIYLNPYKAGLIPTGQTWPWFICGNEDQAWFSGYVDKGVPEPVWIADLP